MTGPLGQDGRLLTRSLVAKGYSVVGVSKPGAPQLNVEDVGLAHHVVGDLCDASVVEGLLEEHQPAEVYHLAAVHHSSQEKISPGDVDLKETMLRVNFDTTRTIAFTMMRMRSRAHLVFAASSQMYTARALHHGISEASPRDPSTFYGFTKSWSFELLGGIRQSAGLRTSCAILFNHESSRRDPRFVSRKVTQAAAQAKAGLNPLVKLMNVGAMVDWSSAQDVVDAMILMGGSDISRDYVVSSGRLRSVRELAATAFGHVGLDWRDHVSFDLDAPIPSLVGRSQLLSETLFWRPSKGFETMIAEMVEYDLMLLGCK